MKIGRNELCPCGSGKKYKHCCINKNNQIKENTISNETIDMLLQGIVNIHKLQLNSKKHIKEYYRIRTLHSEILDSMVNYFENNSFGFSKQLKNILNIDINQLDDIYRRCKSNFDIDIYYSLFIYKNDEKVQSITEIYLEKNKFKKEEKMKLLQAMNDSYIGTFEVKEIDYQNGYVELKDIFTKKEFKIVDVSLSSSLNAKNFYFYARIINFNDISFLSGINLIFSKENKKFLEYITKNKEKSDLIRIINLYKLYKKSNVNVNVNYIKK